jgi:tRNA-modifying protein YgfZ
MATKAMPELDAQYRGLREGAGVLDRSARGKLVVRGREAADYLQGQLTNDIEALAPGEGCYSALLDRKGHIQADMRVLHLSTGDHWIDTEATAAKAVRRHLDTYKVGRDVEVEDVHDAWAIISLIGPAAAEVAVVEPPSSEHAQRFFQPAGTDVLAVATDLGLDLITAADRAGALREALTAGGAVDVSEAAAEILRLESGRPRFGAEMSSETMPAEVGIVERAVDFEKGCYIGQETVARLHYRGKPNRQLRGLRLSAPAQPGAELFLGQREVGSIGSACVSPVLGPIALAVVRHEAEPGDTLHVASGAVSAEVVELPFGAPL